MRKMRIGVDDFLGGSENVVRGEAAVKLMERKSGEVQFELESFRSVVTRNHDQWYSTYTVHNQSRIPRTATRTRYHKF